MSTTAESSKTELKYTFKSPTFHQRRSKNWSKRGTWRSLKQIITTEKQLAWPVGYVHYGSINAPPSFKPAMKFSDLSGLPAPYTDPQTRLRFANKEEYKTLSALPMDITAGYLALRRASSIVG